MSQNQTSSDLEVLFIEKLQQKYKLNERDLKKDSPASIRIIAAVFSISKSLELPCD